MQVFGEWAQVEVVELVNDGSGLAFGIVGGRSSGVVVKSVLPGGVADRFLLRNKIGLADLMSPTSTCGLAPPLACTVGVIERVNDKPLDFILI
ncbi:hypothetical protein evm_002975 [Chilo suppressalis]|nr:hypothetical protein evm_002975 [Chilo suppressalis]